MEDKKAAENYQTCKKHPDWYTAEDVRFAKMVRNIKKQEKEAAKSDN